jgi:ComF family protein
MNNWSKNNQLLNLDHLTTLIFKQNCLLCTAPTHTNLSLCAACIADFPPATWPCCPTFGISTSGEVCGKCMKQPPHFDETHALFTYTYPADAIIQHYKYRNALYLSATFAELLIHKLQTDIDLIITMPLHDERVKERGFNQSLEIAKIIARRTHRTVDSIGCYRVKNTPPQASPSLKRRLNNMRGAFQCKQSYMGQHVALLDDVMTTGASLNELAKVIKKAGASKVSCYVLARTQ